MDWNPDTYNLFQKERFAPFKDLSRMIRVRKGLEVLDLGCGTGELTARLSDILPDSRILGVDVSLAMLDRAVSRARDGLRFEKAAIESVTGAWDMVFSNAAIHWVDGHETLIPRLFSLLRPGGQLLVQLPSNHNHPSHLMIAALAATEPFRTALHGWTRRVPVLSLERYAEILYACGARYLSIFEKVYPHELRDADALADWLSGTTMLPYLERLDGDMKDGFLEAFRSELRRYWPDGPIFFGFKRILFSAFRASSCGEEA